MPDAALLTGTTQQVMAWVILSMVALYVITVRYFIKRQTRLEDKYDALQEKTLRIAVRSQRAIETLADLPELDIESDLKGEEE